MTKEQEQVIRDAMNSYYRDGIDYGEAILKAFRVYDEQVSNKTAQTEKLSKVINTKTNKVKTVDEAINEVIADVESLLQFYTLTESQNFNLKRALTHLELALKDSWEHGASEVDTCLEIKAISLKNSKNKKVKSVYIKDNGNLCIELSD